VAKDKERESKKQQVEDLMIDRMDLNRDLVTRYLNDPRFQEALFPLLVKQIYEQARATEG
jgi:hypothetical protein